MSLPLLSRKELQVFNNVSFDPRAIAVIAYFVRYETQDSLYRSEVLYRSFIWSYLTLKKVSFWQ